MRRQMSDRTLAAIVLAVATVWMAHASGKPWWQDHPLGGDAFDVGLFSFITFRVVLALADRWSQ